MPFEKGEKTKSPLNSSTYILLVPPTQSFYPLYSYSIHRSPCYQPWELNRTPMVKGSISLNAGWWGQTRNLLISCPTLKLCRGTWLSTIGNQMLWETSDLPKGKYKGWMGPEPLNPGHFFLPSICYCTVTSVLQMTNWQLTRDHKLDQKNRCDVRSLHNFSFS